MYRNGWNGWKWMEMDEMAGKELYMAGVYGHGWSWLKWLEMA